MKTTKPIICQAFGQILRKHRIEKGLTQEDLADLASLDRTYISSLERGIRNPSLIILHRLSLSLGISVSELVKHLENQRP